MKLSTEVRLGPGHIVSDRDTAPLKRGTAPNFRPISVVAKQLDSGGQQNFARCFIVSWAGTLYMHFWGFLPPDGILPGAKFTLRPSLAFSYISSVTARHWSSGRQPNSAAWYKEWNYGTFAEGATYIRLGGHRIGQWPTF